MSEKDSAILNLVIRLADMSPIAQTQIEKEFFERNGSSRTMEAVFTLAEWVRFERLANKLGLLN